MSLSGPLGIRQGETVAITGSGGKTTLMLRLAAEWRAKRVLLSTTTSIARDEVAGSHYLYSQPEQWRAPSPAQGIHVAGIEKNGSLQAPPLRELQLAREGFDLTLLECDDSRGLPLKGWRENEPVVPDFADLTVGVTTIWPVGRPVSDSLIYQKGLFIILCGAALGESLTLAHMATAIAHPRGLFHNACGRRALLINQIKSDTEREAAKELVKLLPEEFARTLDCIVVGSLHQKEYIYLAGGSREPLSDTP